MILKMGRLKYVDQRGDIFNNIVERKCEIK